MILEKKYKLKPKETNFLLIKICLLLILMFISLTPDSSIAQTFKAPANFGVDDAMKFSKTCLDVSAEDIRKSPDQYPGVIGVYDKTNGDQIKDLLPDVRYEMLMHPEIWGRNSIIVTPYTKHRPPDGYLKSTQKYVGQCKLGSEGELLNHVAGAPFSEIDKNDPEAGLKIAWNFDQRSDGDDFSQMGVIAVTDRAGNVRRQAYEQKRIYCSKRTTLPPLPATESGKGREGIFFKNFMGFHEPYDLKGICSLTVRYNDPFKDDDQWMYVPSMRRFRRMSTAQRMDTVGGWDITWDDFYGFDGKVAKYNFKLIGIRPMLCPRYSKAPDSHDRCKKEESRMQKGSLQVGFEDDFYQKIDVYEVEVTSKDPNHIYSRITWYIDPEYCYNNYFTPYDRQGRVWRNGDYRRTESGPDRTPVFGNGGAVDIQRRHSTRFFLMQTPNLNVQEDQFTLDQIKSMFIGR